jgi:hypothetical protein
MKVLVDTGVISAAEILVGDSMIQELKWGDGATRTTIAGFKRIEPSHDVDQQNEKDALFTIGRLAREGKVELYTYSELTVEMWRRPRGRDPLLNAFLQCQIQHCPAPIERSKFRTTIDMDEWIAKGGKTDREKGIPRSEFNQIPFFEWLSNLSHDQIAAIVSHSKQIGLDEFEVISLQDLPWFQRLARAFASPENLPDCFHIWTARRNGMDALLTLEKRLPSRMLKNRASCEEFSGFSPFSVFLALVHGMFCVPGSVFAAPQRHYGLIRPQAESESGCVTSPSCRPPQRR